MFDDDVLKCFVQNNVKFDRSWSTLSEAKNKNQERSIKGVQNTRRKFGIFERKKKEERKKKGVFAFSPEVR